MKNILTKSLIFIIMVFILVNFFTAFCYADNFDLKRYESTGDTGEMGDTITKPVKEVSEIGVAIVRIVGSGIAIIMIIAVAIKYMSAAPGERADIKKSSIQFVIGALIVFGSSNILGVLVDFASNKIK